MSKNLLSGLALAALVALGGCATRMPVAAQPSYAYDNVSEQVIAGKLAGLCAMRGQVVVSVSPAQVLCQGAMGPVTSEVLRFMMTDRYGSSPEMYIRFTIYSADSKVHVQAYQWVETTSAFGQKHKIDLNTEAQYNTVQMALERLMR